MQRKRSKQDEVSQIQIRDKNKKQHSVAHSKLDRSTEGKLRDKNKKTCNSTFKDR